MACRQRDELLAPAVEERIGADEERTSVQLDERAKGSIDLTFRAGLQDNQLHPLSARRFLQISYCALGTRTFSDLRAGQSTWPGEPDRKAARDA